MAISPSPVVAYLRIGNAVGTPGTKVLGTYLLPPIEMPGSKGFLRIRAEQP